MDSQVEYKGKRTLAPMEKYIRSVKYVQEEKMKQEEKEADEVFTQKCTCISCLSDATSIIR